MRRSLHVVFGLVVVLTAAAGCTGSEPPAPPPAPTAVALGGHQVDAGLVAAVDAFFADDLGGSYRNRRSLLVTIGGQTLMERHDAGSTAASTFNVQSVGKSILATLVGVAVGEGRLRLDATLGELLPAYRALMSPGLRAVTLRQLLSMSSGLPFTFYPQVFGPDVPHDVDWVRTILTTGQQQPAGRFEYSNGGTHLIAAALQGAVGPLLDYARRTLFDPLGIDTTPAADGVARPENIPAYDAARFSWPTDPQGIHLGSGGQKLTATDLAKLGQLWLAGGRWNGRQLVPVDYLTHATTRQIPVGPVRGTDYGYGYGFWTSTPGGHRAFSAHGGGGQLVQVVPALDLVVVIQSTSPTDLTVSVDTGTADDIRYAEIIRDLVIPRIR